MPHGQLGDKKCSARQHLRFPLQLFSAPRSRHWLRPSTFIASPTLIRGFITGSPPLLVAAVRRLVAQLAVALARDLALVHHQIAGDELHSMLRLVLEIDIGELLAITVAHDEAGIIVFIDGPGRREVASSYWLTE
jgi:hypothetical protein